MKSFLAVLAGLAFTVLLTTGIDMIMYSSGVFTQQGSEMTAAHWLVATGYRVLAAIGGCWIAARLAPSQPMKHALVLGGLGALIALVGCVLTWNRGPDFGPHWYPILLIVTAMPSAWLGGKLGAR